MDFKKPTQICTFTPDSRVRNTPKEIVGKILKFEKRKRFSFVFNEDKDEDHSPPKQEHPVLKYLDFLAETLINSASKQLIIEALNPLWDTLPVEEKVVLAVRKTFSLNLNEDTNENFETIAQAEELFWNQGRAKKMFDFDFAFADQKFHRKTTEVNKVVCYPGCPFPEQPEWDVPGNLIEPRYWFLICLRMFRMQFEINRQGITSLLGNTNTGK